MSFGQTDITNNPKKGKDLITDTWGCYPKHMFLDDTSLVCTSNISSKK